MKGHSCSCRRARSTSQGSSARVIAALRRGFEKGELLAGASKEQGKETGEGSQRARGAEALRRAKIPKIGGQGGTPARRARFRCGAPAYRATDWAQIEKSKTPKHQRPKGSASQEAHGEEEETNTRKLRRKEGAQTLR